MLIRNDKGSRLLVLNKLNTKQKKGELLLYTFTLLLVIAVVVVLLRIIRVQNVL